ncbi:class I SAM-dependent methyltransferase [Solidesulfovibrio sp.]|uniref:class I SAM-dependent methyltransferase n=1 Tax=Solidesulfovibrio sp. TaxID=2910990 RepID=UPI002B211B9F|nr:class I SAM-dependent methyltransferase [Solidesulfovibrio sp.]MEA5088407.1 class I SAM-dependent methyltransferase [Solidesulfovibrio sp.]
MLNTLECLRQVHQRIKPSSYFEIGVREGGSLALSGCQSIGVDPAFNILKGVKCPVSLYRMTSDEFFEKHGNELKERNATFDLALIDGYHNFDFALRDFINLEKYTSKSSLILMDDVLPRNASEAVLKPSGGAWAGDVWRIVACLQEFRSDLELIPIVTSPCGLLVIRNLDSNSTLLKDNYPEILKKYQDESLYSYPGMEALIELYGFKTIDYISQVL